LIPNADTDDFEVVDISEEALEFFEEEAYGHLYAEGALESLVQMHHDPF